MRGREAVELMGCSRSMLCQYRKNGVIRAIRLENGLYEYSEEDVEKILNKHKQLNHQLAVGLVTALGYDLEALKSADRRRALSDQRRVVAAVLYSHGYSMVAIARFLKRNPSSISHMVHTAHLVKKEIGIAKLAWNQEMLTMRNKS